MRLSHRMILVATVFLLLLSCGCKKDQPKTQYVSNSKASDTIVYITKTGECYHTSNCYTLRKSKIKRNLDEVYKEYRPCSNCCPPEIKEK